MRRFQIPPEGLSFEKTLAKFGIIYAADLLLQTMAEIICVIRYFNYKPLQTMLNYMCEEEENMTQKEEFHHRIYI